MQGVCLRVAFHFTDIMASSAPKRLQSQMVDALSCITCFDLYDQDRRLPKMFPCLHTVCLACAEKLCQHSYASTFCCPTCQKPVPILSQGAFGLPTNLDARNMAEIIHKAKTSFIVNRNCSEHSSRSISHVCVTCKIGLCSRRLTSSAISYRHHGEHRVLEINYAFDEMKETCDTLVVKGKKVYKFLSTESQNTERKKKVIESVTASLLTAQRSKNLGAFHMIQILSNLLDETAVSADNQRTELPFDFNLGNVSNRKCTADTMKYALEGLNHGKLLLESCKSDLSQETIVTTKVASATVLLDVLRLKLYRCEQDSFVEILHYLRNLAAESESFSQRLVLLGAANLLVSCFEAFKSDPEVCRNVLTTYGNLACHRSVHEKLLSPRAVDMFVYCIQKFTMSQGQIPATVCGALSPLLCNATLKWPENCASRENMNNIVTKTFQQLSLTDPFQVSFLSFESFRPLLSQQVSEASKYWPMFAMHACIQRNPVK